MTSLQVAHALWLTALAVAASSDVATRRIPNEMVVVIAAVGLASRWLASGAGGVAASVLAAAAIGTALLLAWRSRIFGGGDVKLAAAAVCGLALERLAVFAIATALMGGLLSALLLVLDHRARTALRASAVAAALGTGGATSAARVSGAMVPYGVAIAVGAAVAAVWT